MSHTKGKWVADRWDGMVYGRESNQAHKGLHHAVFIDGEDLMICPTGLPDDPESEANAKLIAAAPELLKALEHLLSDAQASSGFIHPVAIKQAKAAIAKAKS